MSSVDPRNVPPEPPEEAAASGTLISSIALKQRAGGIVVPVLTALIAFVLGGLVVLATRAQPHLRVQTHLRRRRAQRWIFHPYGSDLVDRARAYNLSQTLLRRRR